MADCASVSSATAETPCDVQTNSGLILVDRADGLRKRIYISSGSLAVETAAADTGPSGCIAVSSGRPLTPMDVLVTQTNKGFVIKDRNSQIYYRLRIISGVLSVEAVS